MMTFTQFIWLDTLARSGGSLPYLQLLIEEEFRGGRWAQFKQLRSAGLISFNGRGYPFCLTERGKIAHAIHVGIYARQAAYCRERPYWWKVAA